MSKATLYVERKLNRDGNVMDWVNIAPGPRTVPAEVCLRNFKRVFGFTPRKNKTYEIKIEVHSVRESEKRLLDE